MSIITFEQAIGLAHFPPFFVSEGSAARFTVQINATTRVTLDGTFVKPNSGAYTFSYDAPQYGQLTAFTIEHVDAADHVLGSTKVTGSLPTMQQLFINVVYPAAAVRNWISWNNILTAEPTIPLDGLSNEIDLENTDGTWTVLRGSGFTFAANGVPDLSTGTVNRIEQWNSTGTVFLQGTDIFSTELGGRISVPLKLAYAGLFDNLAAQTFYAALFANATTVLKSGSFSGVDGPFEPYIFGSTFNGAEGVDVFSGGVANDVLNGLGSSDTLRGLAGDNSLFGGAGNDALFGGSGNDAQDGGPGNDSLAGGADNDTYVIDSTGDTVAESPNQGTDTVRSPFNYTLGANVENLTLTGLGNTSGTGNGLANVIIGNGGADVLNGGAGNDTLTGGAGNDTLIGGLGRDVMSGNAGVDRFDFNSAAETGKKGSTRDLIADFVGGEDIIDLSSIDANGSKPGDTFIWRGSKDFSHKAGQLHYVKSGHKVIVEGDIDGNGKKDFQIEIANITKLADADFAL